MQIPAFIDANPIVRRLPLAVRTRVEAYVEHINAVLAVENLKVMGRLAPSAARGLFLRQGRAGTARMQARHRAWFDFDYPHDNPEMRALYEKAKRLQWNGSTDLPWQTSVDPYDPDVPLVDHSFFDWQVFRRAGMTFTDREKLGFEHKVASWMLSQFLHGEQGALMAAAQVTEATEQFDGKFYGATQVMDEARHVEVFHRYLSEKLELRYEINDNLFTIIDGLMTDGRWDMKFLGMQILVEGLALGAFATLRKTTGEPLLEELLRRVIHDEARHVRYGLLALAPVYRQLSERERREREDWAFEVVVLMRNRFLVHEMYEEDFAHKMSRREWNRIIEQMPGLAAFRRTMFRRLVPNLRAIGLLTPRVVRHYERVGLGQYIHLPSTDRISDAEMVAG